MGIGGEEEDGLKMQSRTVMNCCTQSETSSHRPPPLSCDLAGRKKPRSTDRNRFEMLDLFVQLGSAFVSYMHLYSMPSSRLEVTNPDPPHHCPQLVACIQQIAFALTVLPIKTHI